MPRDYFPKVKEAREVLKEKALELYNKYQKLIDLAIEKGEVEVALKYTQWLIEHMPNEEGVRVIDPSAAKPKEVEGARGPSIQIGFKLGGIDQKLLPEPVIDVEKI